MTKKSPEEYFSQQSFGVGGGGEFTPAERAFMQKYLGLDEADILRKIGITPPAAPAVVQPVAMPPAAPAQEPEPPVAEAPLDEAPVAEAPADEALIGEVPEDEVPVDEAPADEAPVDETPAVEAPVAGPEFEPESQVQPEAEATEEAVPAASVEPAPESEAPVAEAPAVEAPASEAGVTEVQAAEAPAVEVQAAEAPAVEVQAAEAPAVEAEAVEAPAAWPEIPAQPEPEAMEEAAPAPPVAPPAPAPAVSVEPAPAPAPAEAAPVEVTPAEAAPAPVAEVPVSAFEPDEPSLESIMRQAEEQQLVAFYLGEQEFVLPIIAVQEVIKAVPYTRLPSAPALVAGVINLRGRVTPLLQLRELLGVARTAGQDDGFIVICRRRGIQMGLIIDKVHTMYRVVQKDVDWAVESHLGNVEVVSGLLKMNDRLLGIISVDKIFSMLLET